MNKKILVAYELRKPGQNYTPVHSYLQGMPTWAKVHPAVYVIKTSLSAAAIRDALMKLIDANDMIYVAEIGFDWASYNLPTAVTDWLKTN